MSGMIEWIRAHRRQTGCSLYEAKQAWERMNTVPGPYTMESHNHELVKANTRYLLRARKSEELLFQLLETHTMNTKPTLELLGDIERHLRAPWL